MPTAYTRPKALSRDAFWPVILGPARIGCAAIIIMKKRQSQTSRGRGQADLLFLCADATSPSTTATETANGTAARRQSSPRVTHAKSPHLTQTRRQTR